MATFATLTFGDSPAIDTDNDKYLVDEASNLITASFKVPYQSKMLFKFESSHASFCTTSADKSGQLKEDLVITKQNKTLDSVLDQVCAFNNHDLHVMPAKNTEPTLSTVRPLPSLNSASTTPICESQHSTFSTAPLNLPNNRLFKDLQATLLDECKRNALPSTLLAICKTEYTMDVYTRERDLQRKFDLLQKSYPQKSDQLLGFFQYHFALIEAERFKSLQEKNESCSYHASINSHFDRDLHKIMDRVEKSLKLLDEAAKGSSSKRYMPYIPCQRPKHFHCAVKIMEEWHDKNYEHPYPNSIVVEGIAKAGGITNETVKKWFANKCKDA